MTYIDLVALLSACIVLLAIGGAVTERVLGECREPRAMAHRVKR